MDIKEDLPDEVAKEPILSNKTKLLLSKLKIRTFSGLARMKRGTLLKKAPNMKVRMLDNIEECLSYRELFFIPDDTISSFHDNSISQRKLLQLWILGVIRYKDFNKFHYWKIVRILGKTVFGDEGTFSWMEKRGVVPSNRYEFYNVGFSKDTLNKLMSSEIETFEAIEGMNEYEVLCALEGVHLTKLPSQGSLAMARLREIKYILWKNGKKLTPMNNS